MSRSKTIIVGGGLAGLMTARMVKALRDPEGEIYIVERESHFGGAYGSYHYEGVGAFDHGMHVFYETCIPEVDELFTSILPDSDWNILVENLKDAAGIYVQGRLQLETPYVDLRDVPDERLSAYLGDLMLAIRDRRNKPLPAEANAYEVMKAHYGRALTDDIFVPLLEKLFLRHPSQLHELATRLAAINRIAAFDGDLMLDLMKSDELRARLCFPDQYKLPPYRGNNQRGFYPRQFGFYHVMDRLKEVLDEQGIHFVPNASLSQINTEGGRVQSVRITSLDGVNTDIDGVTQVFWAAGVPPLAKLLNVPLTGGPPDMRPASWYVHLLLDKEPMTDRLYYFYCFDKGFRTYRVTNYAAYCPEAHTEKGWPVCVELWPNPGDAQTEACVINTALSELRAFGVTDATYRVNFRAAQQNKGPGFPLPTLKTIGAMENIRAQIRDRGICNLALTGIMGGKNIFFIPEVLKDAHEQVMAAPYSSGIGVSPLCRTGFQPVDRNEFRQNA